MHVDVFVHVGTPYPLPWRKIFLFPVGSENWSWWYLKNLNSVTGEL